MVEQVNNSTIAGTRVYSTVVAVFEFIADGKILQWREAYDLKPMLDQIKAATGSRRN
jgi:limonene-1,2-epoxide hydrolase